METSRLAWAIAQDQPTRQRIEAMVRDARWNTANADPTLPVAVDQLAWAAASSPVIRDGVAARFAENPSVSTACEGIPDADLTAVVLDQAVPRLAAIAASKAKAPMPVPPVST